MVKKRFRKKSIVRRWEKFLEVASEEVTFLNHYADIREQFYLIAAQSPVVNVNCEFWDFINRAFAHELIIRICRLSEKQSVRNGRIDPNKEIYSLKAVLEEFLDNPEYLSRERFMGLSPVTFEEYIRKNPSRFNPPDDFEFKRMNREFDGYAGVGAPHFPKATVQKDIETLLKVIKPIKAYRDKHLAHNSVRKGRFKALKLRDVLKAIRVIDAMMRKYFLMFNSSTHTLNFSSVDITDIFLKPWILNKDFQKKVLIEFEKEKKAQKRNLLTKK